jgi:hypothetical protein
MSALQFSINEGVRLREDAIDRVEESNADWVAWMRGVARRLATENGSVCADDLHDVAHEADWHPREPRAYGAVFRSGGQWAQVGVIRSRRPVCHRRPIPIWELAQ